MTLVEISIGMAIMFLIIGVSYAILSTSTLMLAKNVSLNSTNSSLRQSLDRINSEVTQANGMPALLNTDGTTPASNGPAAGIVYDSYIGGPFVVPNPGVSGLVAGTVTFQLTLATNALAFPPLPNPNDVVALGGSTVRPLVNTCSPATLSVNPPALQTVTVALKSGLASSVPWPNTVEEKAFLIHRRAIVVVPTNGLNQLRLYNNVETTTSSCDLTSSYVVLNQNLGTQAGDNTPFSLVTQNGNSFLSISMHVENQQYNVSLSSHQAKQFNTFLRVDTLVRPRNFLSL